MILGTSDHDLLIKLTEQMEFITTLLTNHLEHHFWFNVTMLSIVGGLVVTLLITALKKKKSR